MIPPVPLVQVRAWVVLQHDGHVPSVVDVEQDGLDPRGAALEEHVVGIGARASRRQPDPAAPRDADAVDDDGVGAGGHGTVRARVPPRGRRPGQRRRLGRSAVGDPVQGTHRAVQAGEHLLRQYVDPIHDLFGSRVGGPRLALLLLGERQRAQREDLVDLRRVEQVTGAFRRDPGVVVQDDR